MLTKIVLIRHGQTSWNLEGRFQGQSDTDLIPEGIKQAQLLAEKFPLQKIDAVYCSDLSRTKCTAKPIAERFGLTMKPVSKLREMSFGQWEGILFEDINKKWPNAMKDFFDNPQSVSIPEGENFQQVQDRAMQAIRAAIKENSGGSLAIVAHGAVNRAILAYAVHIPFEYVWSVGQSNTAYNILSYDDEFDKFYVQTINNTSHLLKQ
ncbi:histidine phosphatase family protein [Pectinatus haikarae]|uniref:Alpha-ribazole phosphatase n=1 Tax=Pectinatus haikarae TaxID=349096 RepID=A0ABT9Y5T1_9FIRM|nr:histidine phosphatase family protein [Pectinatus haikarae]MDQ0203192.1 alpha-ribazole phosphatase [Pectinatus haikarae]